MLCMLRHTIWARASHPSCCRSIAPLVAEILPALRYVSLADNSIRCYAGGNALDGWDSTGIFKTPGTAGAPKVFDMSNNDFSECYLDSWVAPFANGTRVKVLLAVSCACRGLGVRLPRRGSRSSAFHFISAQLVLTALLPPLETQGNDFTNECNPEFAGIEGICTAGMVTANESYI